MQQREVYHYKHEDVKTSQCDSRSKQFKVEPLKENCYLMFMDVNECRFMLWWAYRQLTTSLASRKPSNLAYYEIKV